MNISKYLNKTSLLEKMPFLAFVAVSALSFVFVVKVKTALLLCLIWGAIFHFAWSYKRMAAAVGPFVLFTLYLYAERFTHGKISSDVLTPYLALGVGLVFLLSALGQIVHGRLQNVCAAGAGIVLFLLSLPAVIYLLHILVFDVPISPDVFFAIGQTNFNEAMDFVLQFIGLVWLIPLIATAGLFVWIFMRESGRGILPMPWALIIFVVLTSVVSCKGSDDNLRMINSAKNYTKQYAEELEKLKQAQKEKKTNNVEAVATDTNQTAVLVIGEALNKRHMGLYGYGRDTTPELSALYNSKEIVRLDNAYSPHTHTMQTLSLALTEANSHNEKKYTVSPTIIDVARGAGYETWWISNQVLMGTWDNLVSVIANTADNLVSLNKNVGASLETHNFDGAAVEELKKILNTPAKGNRLVVIHLMGSHGFYCDRFPKDFDKFEGTKERDVDCYDNSVLYNDTVIKNIIDALNETGAKSFMFYFSDHAEDIYGQKGHNSTQFTYEMTYIPGIAWFSKDYKKSHAQDVSNFVKNAGRLFSNEYTYDMMIDFMGIKTAAYDPQGSLADASYSADKRPAYILGKERNYRDPENLLYHLGHVQETLVKSGQEGRIAAHRVNTMGKLHDVLNAGFRDFEIDLVFDETSHRFEVGHDAKSMTGFGLEDFLKLAPEKGYDKIWFDIKNMNARNSADMQAELDRLDTLYNIKSFALIESSRADDGFATLSGYHTSYYLPTEKIEKALEAKDASVLKEMADGFAAQVERQKLDAVSFDISLYPFVKEYLEPKLAASIVYHTWDTKLNMKDADFIQKITAKDYYGDKRIKTILVSYPSRFGR